MHRTSSVKVTILIKMKRLMYTLWPFCKDCLKAKKMWQNLQSKKLVDVVSIVKERETIRDYCFVVTLCL